MATSTIPNGVINPFSENFVETWNLWKEFRWQSHKFKYKGNISEQMALAELAKISEGDETTAVAIVRQSISHEWMGFYKLKTVKLNPDGTKRSKKQQQQPAANNNETRQQFDDLYNRSDRQW